MIAHQELVLLVTEDGFDVQDLKRRIGEFCKLFKNPKLRGISFRLRIDDLRYAFKFSEFINKLQQDLFLAENHRISVLIDGGIRLFDLEVNLPFFLRVTLVE